MHNLTIRPIEPGDNPALATLVRDVLREHGITRPGTVYTDPTTDHLYELFQRARSRYFVALLDEVIVGGAGVYHTDGLPETVVELARVYLRPQHRGLGLGRQLIELCFQTAIELAYAGMYLETVPEMGIAVPMYERLGFRHLSGPMGNTGHFGLGIWMLKTL